MLYNPIYWQVVNKIYCKAYLLCTVDHKLNLCKTMLKLIKSDPFIFVLIFFALMDVSVHQGLSCFILCKSSFAFFVYFNYCTFKMSPHLLCYFLCKDFFLIIASMPPIINLRWSCWLTRVSCAGCQYFKTWDGQSLIGLKIARLLANFSVKPSAQLTYCGCVVMEQGSEDELN